MKKLSYCGLLAYHTSLFNIVIILSVGVISNIKSFNIAYIKYSLLKSVLIIHTLIHYNTKGILFSRTTTT